MGAIDAMSEQQRRKELADFLRTRRSRLTPAQVGLSTGSRRRVPGLRREEVAELADIGVTWYTWLEQARPVNVSVQTLEQIAQALQLDAQEQEYLFLLAGQSPVLSSASSELVTASMRQVLESLEPNPAYITCPRWDLLAWNRAACTVFGEFEQRSLSERNLMWLAFTDPAMHQLFVNWNGFARCLMLHFRADYGRSPGAPRWAELVAALQQVSPEFRSGWSSHEVARPLDWQKELNHPMVGKLVLDSSSFGVHPTGNLRLIVYTPANTETAEKLQKLQRLSSSNIA